MMSAIFMSRQAKRLRSLPVTIPIVFYTGEERWTLPENYGDGRQ